MGNYEFYSSAAKQYNFPIIEQNLNKILPVADLFLASYSSTVEWATRLGIPTFVLDYGLNYSMFDHIKGLKIIKDIRYLTDILAPVLHQSEEYKNYSELLASSFSKELFDGKACERIIQTIKQNVGNSKH